MYHARHLPPVHAAPGLPAPPAPPIPRPAHSEEAELAPPIPRPRPAHSEEAELDRFVVSMVSQREGGGTSIVVHQSEAEAGTLVPACASQILKCDLRYRLRNQKNYWRLRCRQAERRNETLKEKLRTIKAGLKRGKKGRYFSAKGGLTIALRRCILFPFITCRTCRNPASSWGLT